MKASANNLLVPDPSCEPTISVDRAASLLGISRSTAYAAVRSGEIPSVKFGQKIVIPTAGILRMLGLSRVTAPVDQEPDAGALIAAAVLRAEAAEAERDRLRAKLSKIQALIGPTT